MKKIVYPKICETLYYEKLDNGLDVYLLPKADYNKTFAVFSTNYGGLDNRFVPFDGDELVEYPIGIAHFLEHKLFEMEDGKDASTRLSELGANSNAFTSYGQTSYLFSTTNNVKECVDILLDFVQYPYFTDENVKKEQGIIAQEIMMYADYPEFRAQMGILKNMYEKNNIRYDIVGTVEEINKITKEMLYSCYNTFYHPCNMQLFIIGNFDLHIIDSIKDNQSKKTFREFKPIVREYISDDEKVIEEETIKMDTSMSKLAIGVRLPFVKEDFMVKEISLALLMSIIFGDSSRNKNSLMENRLINESFGTYVDLSKSASYAMLMSDTNDVAKLEEELKKMIKEIPNYIITEEEFERIKKSYIGTFISMLNSLESLATSYASYGFNGIDLLKIVSILEEFTIDDMLKGQKMFENAKCTVFKILPNND